jgi:beta-galactosidase
MAADVQRRLVGYATAGGSILLYGDVPLFDMEGEPCTALLEALGLTPVGTRRAEAFYYLSLTAEGWAAPRPEVRTSFAQVFEPARGAVIIRVAGTEEACGFDIPVGKGRAIVISASYPADDVAFFKTALEKLGARAALSHGCPQHGIFMTSSASQDGQRFLHLLNVDGFAKDVHLTENGEDLLDGRALVLGPREALMLPLNVSFGDVRIVYATAEIARVLERGITFRLSQKQDVIALQTDRAIAESEEYTIDVRDGMTLVTSRKQAAVDDRLTVRWA